MIGTAELEGVCTTSPHVENTTPDTSPDLFAGYAVVWACIFYGLCVSMRRSWSLERRMKKLESGNAGLLQAQS